MDCLLTNEIAIVSMFFTENVYLLTIVLSRHLAWNLSIKMVFIISQVTKRI